LAALFPRFEPIEHIWHHLKKLVLEKYPHLEDMGKSEEAIQTLENALVHCWDLLPDRLFEQAVIKAKGWHTKY